MIRIRVKIGKRNEIPMWVIVLITKITIRVKKII
jgi:hypothetical protein